MENGTFSLKKNWQSNVHLAGGDKKSWFLTFKVNFLYQKLSESFSIFFSLKNINFGASLLLLTFFENSNFETTLLLKSCQFFNRHLPNIHWSAKKTILWKSAIFHSIKPPFDAEIAEKFFNGISYTWPWPASYHSLGLLLTITLDSLTLPLVIVIWNSYSP